MDPIVFRQWTPLTTVGGRAVSGLFKADPPGVKTSSGFSMPGLPQHAVTGRTMPKVSAPETPSQSPVFSSSKPGSEMPSVDAGLKPAPTASQKKETIRQNAPVSNTGGQMGLFDTHHEKQRVAAGAGPDQPQLPGMAQHERIVGPQKPSKTSKYQTIGQHEDAQARAKAKAGGQGEGPSGGAAEKPKEKPTVAAAGPNILGNYGTGYAIGTQTGQQAGPATTVSIATHRLAGAAHGVMAPPSPHETARMQREAYQQRAELIGRTPASGRLTATQSAMKALASLTPMVRTGSRSFQ